MTSTSTHTGVPARSSSRVLKPPGGGTSDLFAIPVDQAESPRKARANQSTLVLGDVSPAGSETDAPVYKPGNKSSSHARLFGTIDEQPLQETAIGATSNVNKSNLVSKTIDNKESAVAPVAVTVADPADQKLAQGDNFEESVADCKEKEGGAGEGEKGAAGGAATASRMPRNCLTGDGCDDVASMKRCVRIYPGKGGNPVTGEGYDTPKSNPSPVNGNPNPAAPVLRNRVPPGGYSSGLW